MSVVVREVIAEGINYYSPPLKKHRYSMSSVERRAYVDNGTASGILMQEIRERERAYSGILAQRAEHSADEQSDDVRDFSDFLDEVEGSELGGQEQVEEKKPKRSFRTIKRIEELIYDDSAVKQGELEDEAYALLNEDGFYDEVFPIDYDEDMQRNVKLPVKKIAMYLGILLVLVGFIVWYIKFFLL